MECEYSLTFLLDGQGFIEFTDWVNIIYPQFFQIKQQVTRFKCIANQNACFRQIINNDDNTYYDYKERLKKNVEILTFDEFFLPIHYCESKEIQITKMPDEPDFTTGNYCPQYGQDRYICYELYTNLRISMGKMYSFSGTYNACSKSKLCYYIELESETVSSFSEFLQQCVKWLKEDKNLIRQLLYSELNICASSHFRIYEMYNYYPRKFIHNQRELKKYSTYWICPKFDGYKMIGILQYDQLQLFNQNFGIKTFTLPIILTNQRLIVQAEYFPINKSYIITEILALSINSYHETFICNSFRHLCNDYNPKTCMPITPIESIKWIQYITSTYTSLVSSLFTHHVLKNTQSSQEIFNVYRKKFQTEWCLLPIDGWLAITLCEKYFKLKKFATIELALVEVVNNSNNCIFKDAQNNLYTDIKLTSKQIEIIQKHCQTGIVEFTIPNFQFKTIRNDKTYPDHVKKIKKLLSSLLSK